MRFSLIFLLFLGLDILSIVKMGGWLGGLATVGLLLVGIMVGGALLNMQKRRLAAALQGGVSASTSRLSGPLNGLAVLLAGGLFIFPGFFSDCLALLLLFPLTRVFFFVVFGQMLMRRLGPRLQQMRGFGPFGPFASGTSGFGGAGANDFFNASGHFDTSGAGGAGGAGDADGDIIEGEFRDVTDLRDRNTNQTALDGENPGPKSGPQG